MKAPSAVCTPISSVVSAIRQHDHQDGADQRHLGGKIVVATTGYAGNQAAAEG